MVFFFIHFFFRLPHSYVHHWLFSWFFFSHSHVVQRRRSKTHICDDDYIIYTPYTRDKMLRTRMGFSMTSWEIGDRYVSRVSAHNFSHARLFALITILVEIDDHGIFGSTWSAARATFTRTTAHWVTDNDNGWLWSVFRHC